MHQTLLVAALVLALKFALVPTAVWVASKLNAVTSAYVAKADAEHKRVKFAHVVDSLGHFISVGVQKEAQAVKDALDAGKDLPALGSVALQTVKDYLGEDGLKELQDVLGIVSDDLFTEHLEVLTKAAAQPLAALHSTAPSALTATAKSLPQ